MRREDLDEEEEELAPTQSEEDELPPTQSVSEEDDDEYYWDEDDQTYEHIRWGVASREDMIAQRKREREEQERVYTKTTRELHASIEAKLIAARGAGKELPVEIANRIWLDGLAGISFDQAMRLIANGVSQFTLTQILSTQNSVWKRWIEREMPDFWRDLHLSHDQQDPPADWLMASRKRVLFERNEAHEDDVLFERVPWRSFYMWLRMFRRQCGKYYGDMFMEYQQLISSNVWRSLGISFNEEVWRSAIQVTEEDGKTLVSLWIRNENADQLEPILLTSDALRSPGRYDALSDAIPYRLFMLYRKTVSRMSSFLDEAAPEIFAPSDLTSGGQRPNVGIERGPEHHERYRYNFAPQAVECFVRWYVSVIVAGQREPVASTINQEDSPFWDTDLEIVSSYGTYMLRKQYPSLLQASMTRGFLEYDLDDNGKKTGKLYWSWLSMLPLCPRRIDLREARRTGQRTWVQFLGQQHRNDRAAEDDDMCVGYMLSHDDTDYMGTALIGTSHAKWLKMAHESSIKGHPVTARQRRYFFAMAGKTGGGGGRK